MATGIKLREPGVCRVDVVRGELVGATGRYVKTIADLAGLYEDAAAFDALARRDGAAVAYEVTDYRPSADAGEMIIGVTRMAPGKVGREHFLTRGYPRQREPAGDDYCESGRGVMLLKLFEGEIRAIEIVPRALCYVPPFWIHRSVNVGADDLVMTFAHPADSGQDYAIIEEAGGMRSRVIEDGAGGWALVDNAGYRGRPASRIERAWRPPHDGAERFYDEAHPRDRADPLFLRRHDGAKLDHESLSSLGEEPRAEGRGDPGRRFSAARARRRLSRGGRVREARPALARRARHDAQDRPLPGLPRSLRRDRPLCAPDGRDELSLEAGRQAHLPRQRPDSSGLALDGYLPARHFERTGAEVFAMGAGGSTIAFTSRLMEKSRGADRPSRVIVSDRSAERLKRSSASIAKSTRASRHATGSRRRAATTTRCSPRSSPARSWSTQRASARTPRVAAQPCSAFSRTRNRMGPQLSRRSRIPRSGARAAKRSRAADRKRLDLFSARMDASHRGSVPHRHPRARVRVRRALRYRAPSLGTISAGARREPVTAPYCAA